MTPAFAGTAVRIRFHPGQVGRPAVDNAHDMATSLQAQRGNLAGLLVGGARRKRRLQKSADQVEKGVEPVMVDPVAGIFDRDDLSVAKVTHPAVGHRV
jgi:hypothetical protein